jgi:nickel transport protein
VIRNHAIRLAALALAAGLAAAPALAHRFNVFAWVEGDAVVVEGKFAGGARPKVGTVRVYDGRDRLIRTVPVSADGSARFPLDDAAAGGVRVEMEAGAGHADYWILTPADIAAQRGE